MANNFRLPKSLVKGGFRKVSGGWVNGYPRSKVYSSLIWAYHNCFGGRMMPAEMEPSFSKDGITINDFAQENPEETLEYLRGSHLTNLGDLKIGGEIGGGVHSVSYYLQPFTWLSDTIDGSRYYAIKIFLDEAVAQLELLEVWRESQEDRKRKRETA